MYRLIASDLDETLLDDSHHVPERVRRAVSAARERGVRFVPCTGRPGPSVAPTLAELGLLGAPGEYVLGFNGGVLTENSAPEEPITSCQLPRDVARRLYARGVELGLCIHTYTLGPLFVYDYLPEERAHIEGRLDIRETFARELDEAVGELTVVKLLYMSLDMDRLRSVARELDEEGLTDGLDVVYSSNRYLEFNAAGVNKGAGLLALAARLGVPREEVMAIGDNSNDVAMLQAAGLGVAVANASEEARAAADYVCAADNNIGGVAEAIERFVLS